MLLQPFSLLLLLQLWSPILSFLPQNTPSKRPAAGIMISAGVATTPPQRVPICLYDAVSSSGSENDEKEEEESSLQEESSSLEEESPSIPESTTADSQEEEDDDSSYLMKAKLIVLENVVKQMNLTKSNDQEHILSLQSRVVELESSLGQEQEKYQNKKSEEEEKILTLQSQVVELEGSLSEEQAKYQTVMESRATNETDLLEEVEKEFNEERLALQSTHKAELKTLEERILRQAQEEQDSLKKDLLEEVTNRKLEWKESLEIATAAVKAGEAREQSLQEKLDDLETRYQEEAAQYKTELNQLQKEWKAENKRLEKDISRLTTLLTETKTERDKDTTALLDQLGETNMKLEQELKQAQEQIQFQKLQFSTQQQVAKEEWQEQRDKERKFYTEAMKLLQQQQEQYKSRSLWRRIFGFGRSRKPRQSRLTP